MAAGKEPKRLAAHDVLRRSCYPRLEREQQLAKAVLASDRRLAFQDHELGDARREPPARWTAIRLRIKNEIGIDGHPERLSERFEIVPFIFGNEDRLVARAEKLSLGRRERPR